VTTKCRMLEWTNAFHTSSVTFLTFFLCVLCCVHVHSRYSGITSQDITTNVTAKNVTASISIAEETPLEVVSPGYDYHETEQFMSLFRSLKQTEAVDGSEDGNAPDATTANKTPADAKLAPSFSPRTPPCTQRKSINNEFFIEEPTEKEQPNTSQRKSKQSSPQFKDTQDSFANDPSNHIYAEINIRNKPKKPHPLSRTGSEGTTGTSSLAMTSISSLTGRDSLFPSLDPSSQSGLGGLWFYSFGSTGDADEVNDAAVVPAHEEENYFDYTNDDTVQKARLLGAVGGSGAENASGTRVLDTLSTVLNTVFYNTCQCFEGVVSAENVADEVVMENDAGVVLVKDVSGAASKAANNAVPKEPTFSLPMEN
jgi:hypothetical protein